MNRPIEYVKFFTLIFLILLYAIITGYQLEATVDLQTTMRLFMGGFFAVFGLFKIANIAEFVSAYRTYDIIAKRSKLYAYVYPFIELFLAFQYFWYEFPVFTNIVTIIVLGISSIGVFQVLLSKKKLRCACLGNTIKLEVSTVTAIEDVGMVVMAVLMLTLL